MDQFTINLLFVGASFALYIGIAIWARAGSTSDFYAAGRGVHPVTNGIAKDPSSGQAAADDAPDAREAADTSREREGAFETLNW